MLFAVPSKGRAGKVKTLQVIPYAMLYVPENEADTYGRVYGAERVRPVPQSVIGITATRNWILDHADDDSVVMVDDDVKTAGYCRLHEHSGKYIKIVGDIWRDEAAKLFAITRALNYRLWGVATQGALRSVYPYKPFLWRSYVTASFCGICNESGVRFDESFRVKEDYELNLRCIVEDGGVVAARYLFWQNSHWKDEGGCKDYRTQAMEEDAIKRLQKKYPAMVRKINRGGSEYSIELTF